MTEEHETKIISRRSAFGILGLGALTLVVAPTVLAVSDAEAQQPSTTQTPSTTTKQTHETGTQHRHERREGRREHRHERREARREHRNERSTVGQKSTGQQTGQKPTKPTGQQ